MNVATESNYPRFSGCMYQVLVNPRYYGALSSDELYDTETDEFIYGVEKVYIKGIRYNKPATIVFWSDGTKTISKCHANDIYSPETGVSICILKKLIGNNHVKTLFEEWLPEYIEGTTDVKLSDVRRNQKLLEKEGKIVCGPSVTENSTEE